MRTTSLMIAFAATVGASVALGQPVRCWTNAQGVTECGTRPPPGAQTREVRVPRPAQTPPEVQLAERFADADMDEDERNRRAIMRQHCQLARETLATYERSDFLYERDATGNRRLLDEEETAAAKAQARHDVEERCAGFEDEP